MRLPARHMIAALAGLTLLAGCGSEPEAPPEPAPVETVEPAPAPPAPPALPPANVAEAAPVEEIAPDEQVLADAEATGMTARVERDATPAEDADQTVTE
ncbi:hypothetical protein [Sphingomonas gilva]|nr:hypothetical protein [Sphingomonas gilva]